MKHPLLVKILDQKSFHHYSFQVPTTDKERTVIKSVSFEELCPDPVRERSAIRPRVTSPSCVLTSKEHMQFVQEKVQKKQGKSGAEKRKSPGVQKQLKKVKNYGQQGK